MRLYLSSYRMGDRFAELVAYLGPGAKVAVVSNALDGIPAELRRQYRGFNATVHFNDHGLDAFDLDLREYFDAPQKLSEALSDVRLI